MEGEQQMQQQQPDSAETNGQASQSYLQYEELTPPDSALTIEVLKPILADQQNWKAQFTALDTLRAMNKYFGKEFSTDIISQVIQELLVVADSIRSNLSKNALILIHEVIANNPLAPINTDILHHMIHKLVEKSVSEKNFIRSESKAALISLENKPDALQEGAILSLCELSQDKNPNIQELAGSSLSAIIRNCRNQVSLIDNSTYSALVTTTFKCLNGKRMQLKKSAKEIGGILLQSKGQSAFKDILSPAEETAMIATLTETKLEQKPSFKDFLAMKKKEGEK